MEKNPWEPLADQQSTAPEQFPLVSRKNNSIWDIQYKRILSVWPWMIPAGLLFLAATWFYLRYQNDVYQVTASIIVQDQSQSANTNAYSSRDPINDNIARLRSPTLLKRLVDSVGLHFHSKIEGQFKDQDLYGSIQWKMLPAGTSVPGFSFEVEKKEAGFQWKNGNQTGTANWNQPFFIGASQVVVTKKSERIPSRFLCYAGDSWSEAFTLARSLSVTSSKISNVVELNLQDIERQRAVDILNNLILIYNNSLLSDKRKSQEQGLKFIADRLDPLAFQLDSIESVLAQFKADKGILLQGEYLQRYFGYETNLNQFQLQQKIFQSSESFLKNPANNENQLALPGIDEPGIQSLINSLLILQRERDQLALTVTENNPKLQMLEKQIATTRQNIDGQLENYKKRMNLTEANTRNRLTQAQEKFVLTPWEEKRMNEILRFQKIKLEQFLSLLQKKEDASVALASISVETFVVRPAIIPSTPIGPAKSQLLLTAFFIGIWLPFVIALLSEFLNNKIISKNQLQQMLTPPVIAELDLVEKAKDVLQVRRKDRSIFGEQIRTLRTSLRFYSKENQPFYILVTSSMAGEGKSFVSANLAASYSLQGKRVALVEFDLRRPKLSKRFGYDQKIGISSVLIGKNSPGDVAFRVNDEGLLDLFPSGPVPPNPSELMSSEKMKELKEYLDQHYDVIIMDTPPNGIVADAQLLQTWANITLVLTRFRFTVREQVREIEEWCQGGLFKPIAVVLNGVSIHGYYGNKYSYYYTRRKYGYKYYAAIPAENEKDEPA